MLNTQTKIKLLYHILKDISKIDILDFIDKEEIELIRLELINAIKGETNLDNFKPTIIKTNFNDCDGIGFKIDIKLRRTDKVWLLIRNKDIILTDFPVSGRNVVQTDSFEPTQLDIDFTINNTLKTYINNNKWISKHSYLNHNFEINFQVFRNSIVKIKNKENTKVIKTFSSKLISENNLIDKAKNYIDKLK